MLRESWFLARICEELCARGPLAGEMLVVNILLSQNRRKRWECMKLLRGQRAFETRFSKIGLRVGDGEGLVQGKSLYFFACFEEAGFELEFRPVPCKEMGLLVKRQRVSPTDFKVARLNVRTTVCCGGGPFKKIFTRKKPKLGLSSALPPLDLQRK